MCLLTAVFGSSSLEQEKLSMAHVATAQKCLMKELRDQGVTLLAVFLKLWGTPLCIFDKILGL